MSHTERKAVEGDAITRDPSETTNRFKNTVQRQPITIFQNPAAQHPLSVCPSWWSNAPWLEGVTSPSLVVRARLHQIAP